MQPLHQFCVCAEPTELEQYDRMLTWMIATYFMCLAFGWSLLGVDYLVVTIEKEQKTEPWISDAVIIGGASAVLSPIIQWSHTIIQTRKTVSSAFDSASPLSAPEKPFFHRTEYHSLCRCTCLMPSGRKGISQAPSAQWKPLQYHNINDHEMKRYIMLGHSPLLVYLQLL